MMILLVGIMREVIRISCLKINELSFAYKNSDRFILENINMNVESGEFICVLGKSGCGKSTFLRLLAGLEICTTGSMLLYEKPIIDAGLDRGMVFQDYGLFPWMTAGENIMLALKQRYPKEDKKNLKQWALDTLNSVGLDDSVYRKLPKELSGGMKQRCAIAQAFSINPPILLMDEPFGALDAVTRVKLQDLLLDLWSRQEPKKTVFFVTHDVDEALFLASRIIVLGQSPSGITFEYQKPKSKHTTRELQLVDPEMIQIRYELITQINKDVASKVIE